MKIDNSLKTAGGLGQTDSSVRGTKSHAAKTSAGATDSVKLSWKAGALDGTSASGEVFDAKRVAEIKLAISEGRFKVDPEKIADGLIQTARDLIRNR